LGTATVGNGVRKIVKYEVRDAGAGVWELNRGRGCGNPADKGGILVQSPEVGSLKLFKVQAENMRVREGTYTRMINQDYRIVPANIVVEENRL
jgi:hypothetical protein